MDSMQLPGVAVGVDNDATNDEAGKQEDERVTEVLDRVPDLCIYR